MPVIRFLSVSSCTKRDSDLTLTSPKMTAVRATGLNGRGALATPGWSWTALSSSEAPTLESMERTTKQAYSEEIRERAAQMTRELRLGHLSECSSWLSFAPTAQAH